MNELAARNQDGCLSPRQERLTFELRQGGTLAFHAAFEGKERTQEAEGFLNPHRLAVSRGGRGQSRV
jgi:hypothetical protein